MRGNGPKKRFDEEWKVVGKCDKTKKGLSSGWCDSVG